MSKVERLSHAYCHKCDTFFRVAPGKSPVTCPRIIGEKQRLCGGPITKSGRG